MGTLPQLLEEEKERRRRRRPTAQSVPGKVVLWIINSVLFCFSFQRSNNLYSFQRDWWLHWHWPDSYVCVLFNWYTCALELIYVCTRAEARGCQVICSVTLFYCLDTGLSLNLGLGWQPQAPVSAFQSTHGIIDVTIQAPAVWLFVPVAGIWTQVFLLAQQELIPTELFL